MHGIVFVQYTLSSSADIFKGMLAVNKIVSFCRLLDSMNPDELTLSKFGIMLSRFVVVKC
jgi:hypothetical protein